MILSWHWRTCRAACPQQEDDVKVGRLGENEYQRIQLLCYSPTPPDTVHCKSMIMKLVNSVLINMNEVVDDLPMAMVLVSCLCLVPWKFMMAGMMWNMMLDYHHDVPQWKVAFFMTIKPCQIENHSQVVTSLIWNMILPQWLKRPVSAGFTSEIVML